MLVNVSRLEDTITFQLIERAQFPHNPTIYKPGGVKIPGCDLSFFDWLLCGQERLHSLVRRYESPDEYPYFPEALEKPILESLQYPQILHANDVNVNARIKESYIKIILPRVCSASDEILDQPANYGSAGIRDIDCVQALSRRIHYGKFVAESKFRQETDRFIKLIHAGDTAGIDTAITNEKVEEEVLARLKLKAETYGREPGTGIEKQLRIDADALVAMYKDIVIPLTKVVEVEYLMQRLKGTQWEKC